MHTFAWVCVCVYVSVCVCIQSVGSVRGDTMIGQKRVGGGEGSERSSWHHHSKGVSPHKTGECIRAPTATDSLAVVCMYNST